MDRFSPTNIKRFLQLCFWGHWLAFVGVQARLGDFDWLNHLHGRDFLQFYTAGKLILQGQAQHLYEQEYFIAVQEQIIQADRDWPRYYSLYPPMLALIVCPLAVVPFPLAVLFWWGISFALFALATYELTSHVIPSERPLVWWGIFSFQPVVTTFWDGQLSAIWLVTITYGFSAQYQRKSLKAGLILSLFALKPQLGVGIGLWLMLQRDWKTLFWMFLGSVLQQGFVYLILGRGVIQAYFENISIYAQLQGLYRFDPSYQHSISGILIDQFSLGFQWPARLIHIGIVLFVLWWGSPLLSPSRGWLIAASLGCFLVVLASPHLLLYDLVLLAPAIILLSQHLPRENSSILILLILYLSIMFAFAYQIIGFSLVPLSVIITIIYLRNKSIISKN